MRSLFVLAAFVTTMSVAMPAGFACEALNVYDFALPAGETGCVEIAAEELQPDSPQVDITNNCDSRVTVTGGDSCGECDASLIIQPGRSAAYTVHHSVGESERADFSVEWLADSGESGNFSGTVRRKEGAEDPCDDSACTTVVSRRAAAAPVGFLAFVVVGLFATRRRRSVS
jgi:MYXO-CTERM domain-containing protein